MQPDPVDLHKLQQAILDSASYLRVDQDLGFLQRQDMRAVRFQLELLKPEVAFKEQRIRSTIVVFGGTQIIEQSAAEQRVAALETSLAADPENPQLLRRVARARRQLGNAHYYDEARRFSRLVSGTCQVDGTCDYVVVTGGGPGIMEAANRGAHDVGAKSVGLNITLPEEQAPNPYITPELCFQFQYFAIRKFHFLLRAKALVTFPGGYGTLDELTDALTLRQVRRMQAIPIILYGTEYWKNVIDFQYLADEGVIADEHLDLISYADNPEQAWQQILDFHKPENQYWPTVS
ncbi:MAG: TIGR00730 family Rossman fold protein [Pirellulales bacterium]|nr:TIGR00730 family Rossman fold protein [Pirellulales bacterium]